MCDSPFDLPPAGPPPPSRAGLSPERGVGVIPLARLQVAQWLSKSSLRRLQIRHTQLPLPPPDAVWNVRAAAPEESPRPTSSCCSCAKTGSGQVIILPRQAVSGRPKPNATNVQNRKNLKDKNNNKRDRTCICASVASCDLERLGKKRLSFLNFHHICLSRACLGKRCSRVYIHKWHLEKAFCSPERLRQAAADRAMASTKQSRLS
eukprot:COSAG06_NODE_2671_length_6467_cov_46.974560_7_plen_206_part_00